MQKGSHRAKTPAKKPPAKRKPRSQPRPAAGRPATVSSKVEGEGSYEAARRYDEHVREFVDTGAVEPSAREAERALDSEEGESLHKADAEGRRRGIDDEEREP